MKNASNFQRTLLVWLGILLGTVAAFWITVAALNFYVYSPKHLINKYFSHIMRGETIDALKLLNATIPPGDATLLEKDVLTSATANITNIMFSNLQKKSDNIFSATVTLNTGQKSSTKVNFDIQKRDNFFGLFDNWTFVNRPLPTLNINITNGNFATINSRNVGLPNGSQAFPVLYPGLYTANYSDDFFEASTQEILVTQNGNAQADLRVVLEKTANKTLRDKLEQQLKEFLDKCATTTVLAPRGCPFEYVTDNRISGIPKWGIISYPKVSVVAYQNNWIIPEMRGIAEISGKEINIFSGEISDFTKNISFTMRSDLQFIDQQPILEPRIE